MTLQEIEDEGNENQLIEAGCLIEKMTSFIPIDKTLKNPLNAQHISAKFCAKVACDYLIDNLPHINNIRSEHRGNERAYSVYWRGVKAQLENVKY